MCATVTRSDSDDDGDVWGDENDHEEPHRELHRETQARHQAFHNTGYREAIEEGKAKTLQTGFNIGFREGAQAGMAWGRLTAMVQTLEIFAGQVSGTTQIKDEAALLASWVKGIPPRHVMLATFKTVLSQAPDVAAAEVSPASSSNAGLSMQQQQQQQRDAVSGADDGIVQERQQLAGSEQDPLAEEVVEALARLPAFLADVSSREAATIDLPDVQAATTKIQERLQGMGFHVTP